MILVNNRDKVEWKNGMTVQDVLNAMGYSYVLITVTVNGEIVPKEDYTSFLIPDHANMKAIHIMHGG